MSHRRPGRCARALTLILATSPLAIAAAQAQGGNQAVALEEISVTSEGNGVPGGAPTVSAGTAGPGLPPVSAPTPLDKPVGEVVTSVGREGVIDNRAATSVADILRNSPGVTVRQGNGPRDVVVSIRGNNARATGVSRNMVVLEDGFPVTQADGSSRFDLVDPRAYSRIDVFRGPQSPFFGNFATGGALNFVTRRGSEINGVEYGVDAGSFGYLNNYAAFGGVSGPFEYSLFTSDTRGNGFISHNSFDTQTINFLGTYAPTPDDRFTLKIINNEVATDLPGRGSLNQFRLNPFQRGCASAAAAAPGCVTYNLLLNGRNGATVPLTADEGAFFRGDRRTIVGGRWEHDFDAFTTWRTQLVFDDRQINQPFYTSSGRGDFPGFNFFTDVTRRGDLFGLPATGYVALAYNTLDSHSLTYNRAPYRGAPLGALTADLEATQANLGGRARVELQLSDQWIAVAGISAENTTINGRNITYGFPAAGGVTTTLANIDRSFLNVAPELSLLYRPNTEWQFRGRVATGYATPAASNLTVTSAGVPGNNGQLQTQENLGFDIGADWTPLPGVRFSVTGFYEFFRNELVTQSPGAGLLSYTFNAPASEHRGVEVGADWAFAPGWRATAAYTFDDQIYTKYVEQLSAGSLTRRFDRAGNHIPGVPSHQLLARVGYEQATGPLVGLGGYVETVFQDNFFIDNANLLKAPGYAIVNLNVHYTTELVGYAKRLNLFFEARNVFDKTYIASAQNLANSISATTGLQNGAGVLANTTGSVFAGAPRNFVGGMRLSF
ncbi:TonB-dependent receptor [Methylorubrum populi]|uniref:TonB-dependent receptor n=1 Tax=Methylorubrum rhodesianum TaxID=29427 RepID=A0ABU9Z8C3_9HYPH|nr:TonB-dependent receptor [Methylorubrum rhodesianum]MBK3402805.1 TonB-dependent receptor [Methylorubrum rhodesianum]MBY0143046.1 TonB-dependent receptor [Methylorubrum populi]